VRACACVLVYVCMYVCMYVYFSSPSRAYYICRQSYRALSDHPNII